MNRRTRFPELDLLRFLAACAVMLFHYTYRGPQKHLCPDSFPLLSQVFKYGNLGVDVFFILSGFVILLTAYNKDAIAFTIARMVRLYPAYWISVTLTAVVVVLTGTAHDPITLRQYLANLTMVHSFFGIDDVSGVYWTLAVELQFYFLVFLVLAAGQVHRIAYFLGLWLFASVVLSLRPPHGIAHFFLIPEWSSYFVAGAMLFLIHREGPSSYKLTVVGACYILSVAYGIGLLPFGEGKVVTQFSAPVIASILALAYAAFLVIALRPRTNSGSNPFHILGLITYPLYLLHQDIGFILLRAAPSGINRLLLLCGLIVVMILLSWLVHLGPERWLARHLKSLLARPEQLAISIRTAVSERLAGMTLNSAIPKTVIPEVVPARLSDLTQGAQSAANAQRGNDVASL
jgi:peptidoglycan/LPS O-acetylase OafA/YrhL